MLCTDNVGLRFGKRVLFENVNMKFEGENCYGIIGANGAGKSTFLKILSGEIEPTSGEVILSKGERISVLKQNHKEYDEQTVLETVIQGDEELYKIQKEKDELYSKVDFTEKDGIRVGILEDLFLKKNGWEAESNAGILLAGLGVDHSLFELPMKDLADKDKVKVLLARALFGEPDVLLLDEPTNGLDLKSKLWLEDFLANYKHTVLVVSHDRHFLNTVCTHMVDIDFEKITLFVGNYDFWYESSQLLLKQMKESNKRKEEKIEELQSFIRRFSANASKSKQATSRKKLLEKITLDEIRPSSRKYPFIDFSFDQRLGKEVIHLERVTIEVDGVEVIKNLNLTVRPSEKIAVIGMSEIAKTALFQVLYGEREIKSGKIHIGTTVKMSYFPKNHDAYFKENINLVEFLRSYSEIKEDAYVRGFLGRMLFSGEESLKNLNVLSGGEKVRVYFAKMMQEKGNVLLLDEPTDHLDIESITSLNKGLERFEGSLLFSSFDQELLETVATRILYIKEDGTYIDKEMNYQEFIQKYDVYSC